MEMNAVGDTMTWLKRKLNISIFAQHQKENHRNAHIVNMYLYTIPEGIEEEVKWMVITSFE